MEGVWQPGLKGQLKNTDRSGKEGSTSFLKKRSKKLLSIHFSDKHVNRRLERSQKNKSFLVLFFKKRTLPYSLPGSKTAFFGVSIL
jgi:hypothetical protein